MSSTANGLGLASSKLEVYLGLRVLPRYFSPDGDLGGVCLGEFFAYMFEMKMGDGGAVN